MEQGRTVAIGGHTIKVTNLDRVMYPDSQTTKAEVLQYYLAVADHLSQQVRHRLLTRKRWPHGVTEESFFEKNLPVSAPEWIPTKVAGKERVRYPVLMADDLTPVFAWFSQIGVLEYHVPQWRVADRRTTPHPDRIVIDLDPGPGAGLAECSQVALAVRDAVAGFGMRATPVLSGSKGMQLYLPVEEGGPLPKTLDPDDASAFARTLAEALEQETPKLVTSRMTKAARPNRVFLDWSQNNGSKTTIAPYSLRGTTAAQVAAPVTWDEVERGDLTQKGPVEVVRRLAELGDPLAG